MRSVGLSSSTRHVLVSSAFMHQSGSGVLTPSGTTLIQHVATCNRYSRLHVHGQMVQGEAVGVVSPQALRE